MKRTFLCLFFATVSALVLMAGTPQWNRLSVSPRLYSISTGPGEDASVEVGISWACDTTVEGTQVLITELSDKKWKRARVLQPTQQERITVFNGMYSKTASGENIHEDAIFTKCGVMVNGLKPDTEYKYVIVEKQGDKPVASSAEYRFKTAGAADWSACIISDFHSYPPIPTRLEVAMAMIDTMQRFDPSLDWVLSPGDVVAWGGSYSFWRRMFDEDNFRELLWARVNGNHDNWTRESQRSHDFARPNPFFTATSYYPQNGYEGQGGVTYAFRYGNTLFLMLNTEDTTTKEDLEAAQAWVRDCVTKARSGENPPTYVVVCQHYEWFKGTNGRTAQYGRWKEVFDELGVDLAVAGNNHIYVRSHALYGDEPTDGSRGTVYIQTSVCDNDRGREIPDEPLQNPEKIAFRWSEGSHSVSAIHMDVNPERMVLTLLDRYGNTLDRTVIPAKNR